MTDVVSCRVGGYRKKRTGEKKQAWIRFSDVLCSVSACGSASRCRSSSARSITAAQSRTVQHNSELPTPPAGQLGRVRTHAHT